MSFRISSTRFWTKGFQSFSTPLIQKRATCESVKHLGSPRLNLSDRLSVTLAINLAKHRAESNSKRGIVTGFNGDTRVFDTMKWEYVCSSSSFTSYTTAAYAAVEASQNPHNRYSLDSLFGLWRQHLDSVIGGAPFS